MFGLAIPFTVLKGGDYIEGLLERDELVNVQLPQKFNRDQAARRARGGREGRARVHRGREPVLRVREGAGPDPPGHRAQHQDHRPDRHGHGGGDLPRPDGAPVVTSGKVCVITGASQGIGRAAAVEMSRQPEVSTIILIARSAEGIAGTAAAMEPGKDVRLVAYDLGPARGHPGARGGDLRASTAAIDLLLNIAGYAEPKSLLDTTVENLVKTFSINVFQMLVLIREMVRFSDGRPAKVLNVASTAGITARPGWVAYAASKAAVVNLSRDPGRGAGRDRGEDLHDLAGPDRDRAAPQAGAGRGSQLDHAAGAGRPRDRDPDARRRADAGRPEHHRPPADVAGGSRPVSRWEYRLASLVLRVLGAAFSLLPMRRRRVVLATARLPRARGQPAVHRCGDPPPAPRDPGRAPAGAVRVRPHRASCATSSGSCGARTTCRRPGWSSSTTRGCRSTWRPTVPGRRSSRCGTPPARSSGSAPTRWAGSTEPEATFLHRHYDYAIASGEAGREPWSRALRTPLERVLPLGTPRTDLFYDDDALAAARARVLAAHPALAGRTVVLYAPTFRGRGRAKAGSPRSMPRPSGRACRRPTRSSSSPTRTSTRPASSTAGFDVVADPGSRHERLAGRGRHPRHGLLVVHLRVGAAAPAARPARRTTSRRTSATRGCTSTTGRR